MNSIQKTEENEYNKEKNTITTTTNDNNIKDNFLEKKINDSPTLKQELKRKDPPKDEKDDLEEAIPEAKKTKKKIVVDVTEDNSQNTMKRKLRLTDLVKLSSTLHYHHHYHNEDIGPWPYELVLVRHGQSEGNEAVARSKKGDLSAYTPEFREKHSSSYRLTDKGIEQAKIAGKWIKENIGEKFDRYYTSEYVRAMETAAYLDLPDAKWYTEIFLRERDKGLLDNISWIERKEKYAEEMQRRKRDIFFWAPPGGESLAHICNRIDHTFNTLRRECSDQRVIIVCHGEIMWGFRVRLERLSQIRFNQLQKSKDPRDSIHNCQILQYTRVHPTTGEIFPYFRFMKSVCPWNPDYSSQGWMEFERPIYTNEELLQSVNTVPRYVNNLPEPNNQEEVDF